MEDWYYKDINSTNPLQNIWMDSMQFKLPVGLLKENFVKLIEKKHQGLEIHNGLSRAAGLKLRGLLASVSFMLGLMVCNAILNWY